jgi:hypothetical protein
LALAFGLALVSCDMGSTSNNAALLPAPTGITATRIGSYEIRISWNAVSGASSYSLYWSLIGGDDVGVDTLLALSGTLTSYTHTNSRPIQYISMSTNNAGKKGPRSPWVPIQ